MDRFWEELVTSKCHMERASEFQPHKTLYRIATALFTSLIFLGLISDGGPVLVRQKKHAYGNPDSFHLFIFTSTPACVYRCGPSCNKA